ncbi:endoglucanase [Sporobacter termitidis DSM 10068]|uniref:Endoglucanase n=1 Tax=Sporobacter termitidis DSM 10068 TaxID=1123282 RepID=A0A1M5UFR6_9FIRM|nr:M20/M25/M40 family metallo-hydrolase [Sporobacter termitidis]SHH61781.1 endoglucanase [Sporobacter termitidis DSM 10068]
MEVQEIIKELCALPGPAGFEQPVAEHAAALLAPLTDEVYTDILGNVIGVRRCGKEKAKKLLFDAHIDEIGFIVTGHEEGFLRFSTLGGVDARMLPAAEIRVLTQPPMTGIVGVLPPHILKAEESDKTIKTEDLFIDIGLTQEEAVKAVPLGTPAVYNTGARTFGSGLVCGKGLDDRACFASILRALELTKGEKLDVDLYVLASCQEEVGERGARTGAFGIAPDWCVAIDVDHARTPDGKEHTLKEIGGGVIVSRGTILNKRLTELAVRLAEEKGIEYQLGVEAGDTGTNANFISISREGVATALFGLPLRYMHSPVEVVSLADAEAAAQLLAEVAKSLKGDDTNA